MLPYDSQLGPRLACAADLVRPGSRLADVGTDHALLPVSLVRRGVCPSAIASDVRPGPAERARLSVERAGLSSRIQVRVGSGLSVLTPDEADDLVIAGMGGETILSILAASLWIDSSRYRLILQPMSRPELLRRWLRCHGFSILREPAVCAGNRLYTILLCEYRPDAVPVGGKLVEPQDYIGSVDAHDGEASVLYLQKQAQRLQKQAAGLRLSHEYEDQAQAAVLEETSRIILEAAVQRSHHAKDR
ncbi:MAG: SAM-dependent methyltransferase [Clostridiales bacterium]|nr:SAM-dependent methyltransferase [Clostridiales bacterium]